MDTVLLAKIILFALIAASIVGAAVCWQQRKFAMTALLGLLVIPLAVGLVKWSMPTIPDGLPNQPQPWTSPAAMTLATLQPFRPAEKTAAGYQSSDACKECHAGNHESWHASYHRTMTQVATPQAVLGDFDNRRVTRRGRDYSLRREGDVCWVKMHDPDYPPSPETLMEVPIVMTTGSHHMQLYWYATDLAQTLGQLPIVYLKETEQWIPRTSSFLKPPESPVSSEMGRWNSGCSKCHSTHPRERRAAQDVWYTQVSELGISCEACHGPGEKHIAVHRQSESVTNDPIVNPADLSNKASSQVCGQCHSVHSNLEHADVVQEDGHGFRPGDDLNETHEIWQRDSEVVKEFLERMDFKAESLRRVFWDDGMVRVSGREFNGLVESACFQQGELSCLSCHSMHQDESDSRSLTDWANDQLSVDAMSDRACIKCHDEDQFGQQHHRHPLHSAGARCYNCHMPHTSYGLLKAIRSHTINSPDIDRDLKVGRPNACNLCHVDKTLQWSAEAMNDWFAKELPSLTDEETSVAASLLWLIKGDAGQRALATWSLGWAEAHQASGTDWIAPSLAQALDDPYDAVRFIARRSLRSLPGFKDLEVNAIGPPDERHRVIQSIRDDWTKQTKGKRQANDALLIGEQGLLLDRLKSLLKQQDNTLVDLLE